MARRSTTFSRKKQSGGKQATLLVDPIAFNLTNDTGEGASITAKLNDQYLSDIGKPELAGKEFTLGISTYDGKPAKINPEADYQSYLIDARLQSELAGDTPVVINNAAISATFFDELADDKTPHVNAVEVRPSSEGKLASGIITASGNPSKEDPHIKKFTAWPLKDKTFDASNINDLNTLLDANKSAIEAGSAAYKNGGSSPIKPTKSIAIRGMVKTDAGWEVCETTPATGWVELSKDEKSSDGFNYRPILGQDVQVNMDIIQQNLKDAYPDADVKVEVLVGDTYLAGGGYRKPKEEMDSDSKKTIRSKMVNRDFRTMMSRVVPEYPVTDDESKKDFDDQTSSGNAGAFGVLRLSTGQYDKKLKTVVGEENDWVNHAMASGAKQPIFALIPMVSGDMPIMAEGMEMRSSLTQINQAAAEDKVEDSLPSSNTENASDIDMPSDVDDSSDDMDMNVDMSGFEPT